MLYGPIFEYFDPIDGAVPESFDMEFARVAERSRQILAHWSKAAILDAGDAIDQLIDSTRESRVEYMLDAIGQKANGVTTPRTEARYEGPAGELEWCMGRADPGSIMEKGPCQWSELFAVQALALVAHGVEEQQRVEALESEEIMDRNVGSFAVDAMEALAKAEVLCRVEELEQNFEERVRQMSRDRTSDQAARAAKRRHAPQNKIKQRFITWYLENQETAEFHSRAQAADRFYRGLSDEEQRLFQPTNATRTLLDALRTHLRESPSKNS